MLDGGRRRIDELKVGDKIWSLADNGRYFVEDEMILMMHAERHSLDVFYSFETVEGDSVSLTGSHNIVVVVAGETQPIFLRASKVTLKHRLVMFNRTIGLRNIMVSRRIGFYSPLTLTGYLLVNGISTSVYADR
ncbi:unnamed protein product [Rotaria magnacalcarata]|uniref:Hedgehog protein Hint domain-containing protein n=1 Tax=Rotaria magnacalcarata TaxID=392030 RepID=A0A814R2Z8_9BILA|nr:unnamed protein product [Rotaria magnacalcarata]CAF1540425.1 unnamed protein product [Rotaria magnacalcarata]